MTLSLSTYKPRIMYGAGYESYVDLPTGGLEWEESVTYELEQSVPPGGTGSVVTGYRRGPVLIRITGEIQQDDPDAVETTLRSIETALNSGSFRLYTHKDPGNDRYYQGCYAIKFTNDLRAGDSKRPARNTKYSLEIVATDPAVKGSTPPTDPNDFYGDVSFCPGSTGMVSVLNPDEEVVVQFEPLTGDLKIAGQLYEQYTFE